MKRDFPTPSPSTWYQLYWPNYQFSHSNFNGYLISLFIYGEKYDISTSTYITKIMKGFRI